VDAINVAQKTWCKTLADCGFRFVSFQQVVFSWRGFLEQIKGNTLATAEIQRAVTGAGPGL